jgi:pleuromutilin/lincosamide/streptogramin A transport system ATP-binding/permease protein
LVPNGCGKTTLLKKIVKQREGVSLSPSVKLGYFSQDLTVLCAEQTVLDNVRSTSKQDETLIRTVLGRLHFIRDDVYKPVGVLSGGERVKVALAKVFLSDVNVLILDEPTNYLDIAAVTALESLLKEYEGTLIFATHDRRLVQTVATRILTFEQGDIKLFDGPYRHYTERHARKNGDEDKEKRRLLVETKLTEVLSRLSLGPSEDLEREFERLLAEKKRLEGE